MFQIAANRTTYLAYFFLMACLAVFAFHGLVEVPFDSDDFEHLADAAAVQEDLSLLLSAERNHPGRPVVELIFLVMYELWGKNAAPYHLLLIALHLCASLLLAVAFRRLGADLELSLLGGGLFLVNVAHFRAVQWVSCLAYPLSLFFALGALLFFLRYLQDRRGRWQFFAVVSLGLAIFSHASAAILCLFFAYLSWRRNETLQSRVLVALPLFLTALAGGALIHLYYPHSPQSVEVAYSAGLGEIAEKLLHFLGTLFAASHWITADLLTSSAHPALAVKQGTLLIGLLALMGLFALVWRRSTLGQDWAVWTLLALLPFLFRSNEALSRYLYLASAGSSLLLAWGVRAALQKMELRLAGSYARIAFVLALISGTAMGVHSLQRAEAYGFYAAGRAHISRGLHTSGLAAYKEAAARDSGILPADAYSRLAISAFLLGEPTQAMLAEAAANDPTSDEIALFLGLSSLLESDSIVQKQGEQGVAQILQMDKGQDLQDLAAIAFYNMGLYEYGHRKDKSKALHLFSRAVELEPHYPRAHFFMGNCLVAQKRPHEALKAYRDAVAQEPNFDLALQNLGFLLIEQNDVPAAVLALEKAVALQPQHDRSWYLLAQIRRLGGEVTTAQQAINQALAQQPGQADYWREYLQLAELYHTRGQWAQARGIYLQATQAMPQYAPAHLHLGQLYYNEGNFTSAIDSLQRAVQLSPEDLGAKQLLASAKQMG